MFLLDSRFRGNDREKVIFKNIRIFGQTLFTKELFMPSFFYFILFWIYWAIAALFGVTLVVVLLRERDRGVQATVAMLLVPVILRLLLIK